SCKSKMHGVESACRENPGNCGHGVCEFPLHLATRGSHRLEEKSMTMKGVFRATLALLVAAACAVVPAQVRAQGTVKMPLDKAVISGDMAKKAAVKDQLSADLAQDIVNECVRIAKGSPGGTLSVFVLAPDGEILAAHRMDGQNKINTVTGYKKAQTS